MNPAPPSVRRLVIAWTGVILLMGGASYFFFTATAYDFDWSSLQEDIHRNRLILGWIETIKIAVITLALSTTLGLLLMFAQKAPFLFLRCLSRFYIEIIRGSPLLVQILFAYYVIFEQFHLDDPFVAGVLIMSGFAAAYMSEIFRAAVESIPESQIDSARAIGLTPWLTYRHVIFPQALRQALPAFAGQAASLIKDSSLLYIISVEEFTLQAKAVATDTYRSFEVYLPLGIGYLILTLPISFLAHRLEKRLTFQR